MAKKIKAQDNRSAIAGYPVKDHGHRFFYKKVRIDAETGEMYLPEGFKYVEFLSLCFEGDDYVWVVLKDEIHG